MVGKNFDKSVRIPEHSEAIELELVRLFVQNKQSIQFTVGVSVVDIS